MEHRAMTSFLELDPALRGLGAYARQHGPECVMKEGRLRVKEWKGPHKPVINMLEAGLRVIGWVRWVQFAFGGKFGVGVAALLFPVVDAV